MNKISITLIGLLTIMFFAGSAYAGVFSNSTGTPTLTITGTNSANLVFVPSPGMLMGGQTTASAFTLETGNTKAQSDAVVVQLTNNDPRVYQVAQDLSTITAGTALTGYSTTAGSIDTTNFKERQ